MKKYIFITLILLSMGSSCVFAQDSAAVQNIHKFGLHASTSSGLGMGYKLVRNNHQFQLIYLPVTFSTSDFVGGQGRVFFNSTALNYFHKISDQRRFDILLFGGLSHWFTSLSSEINTTVSNGTGSTTTITTTEKESFNLLNATVGFAFEIGISERFKLNWQVGYAAYNLTYNITIAPSVGAGLEFALNPKL